MTGLRFVAAVTRARNDSLAHWNEGDRSMLKGILDENPDSYLVSEALVGEGNEVAHLDVLIGLEAGHIGGVFADTLSRQTGGHSNLLAVLTPNQLVVPYTVTFTKVTIKKPKQIGHMFGDAQAGIAWAVADAFKAKKFEKISVGDPRRLRIVTGVFVHWQAEDGKKVFEYNYSAMSLAIDNAINRYPSGENVLKFVGEKKRHGFCSFADEEFAPALTKMRAAAGYSPE